MIIPPSLQRKHDLVSPYILDVSKRVRDILQGYSDQHSYAFVGRLKTSESLAEKIETGRYIGWQDLDDLFACSVIVPTLSDEISVLKYLRQSFKEVTCKIRGATQKNPEVFRFDATRFIGSLKKENMPEATAGVLSVRFEVQIRTAFEHAWSVTTHALTYKGAQIDWRRMRLASQLRATIEQLDQLIIGFDQTADIIPVQSWPEIQAQQAIEACIRKLFDDGVIPTEVKPASWARFCMNLHRLILATKNTYIRDQVSLIDSALHVVCGEAKASGGANFPRSLSLLQFCLGALAKGGFITGPLRKYVPLVTPELLAIYPACKAIGNGFSFEENEPALQE